MGAWLRGWAGEARPLDAVALGRLYPKRKFVAGWQLPVDLEAGRHELRLLLCDRFPWEPARVALVGGPGFGDIPHLERDGVLCVLPDAAGVDADRPVQAVVSVLGDAAKLLDQGLAGALDEDFRNEVRSYWPDEATGREREVCSLLKPSGPSRQVMVWWGKHLTLVGDDEESMRRWLAHFRGNATPDRDVVEPGAFIWLDRPILPREFPASAADVLRLARSVGKAEAQLVADLAASSSDRLLVLLGAPARDGPALVAATIPAPAPLNRGPGRAAVDARLRGFRHKVPDPIVAMRMLGGTRIVRSTVERVDAAWVHGRGADLRQTDLMASTVAMVGCGSVGGAVAALLAQAGVGRLVLIDPELLAWANVGRHALGAQSVHGPKAEELATTLRRSYPEIREVVSRRARCEDILWNDLGLLADADLLISTVGSWGVEGLLNEWHVGVGRTPPIVYGWTEPHACAGRAVAVLPEGGCLACGLSIHGRPGFEVTAWPRDTKRFEPGCGAVYQPYGPTELAHIVATVADLAVDVLLGRVASSTQRIWCGRRALLEGLGGCWTPEWEGIAGDRRFGGFLEELPWNARSACPRCGSCPS